MTTIAHIRIAMKDSGANAPIHIFGSLDPVTTPLYFIAGADIFDGLSWLRYTFSNGDAYYMESYGPRTEGINLPMKAIRVTSITMNHNYL